MPHDSTPDRDRLGVCHSCPKAVGFLDDLARGIGLAQALTGDAPEMEGAVQLQSCPLGLSCSLKWECAAGQITLAYHRTQIMARRTPRGFFA